MNAETTEPAGTAHTPAPNIVYKSLEAFEEKTGTWLFKPGWLPEGMELVSVEADENVAPFLYATQYYEGNGHTLEVYMLSLGEGYRSEINENAVKLEIINGHEYIVFINTDYGRSASTYAGSYQVDISGDMDEADFHKVLESMVYGDEQ